MIYIKGKTSFIHMYIREQVPLGTKEGEISGEERLIFESPNSESECTPKKKKNDSHHFFIMVT